MQIVTIEAKTLPEALGVAPKVFEDVYKEVCS